jgi:hypothetical protein
VIVDDGLAGPENAPTAITDGVTDGNHVVEHAELFERGQYRPGIGNRTRRHQKRRRWC